MGGFRRWWRVLFLLVLLVALQDLLAIVPVAALTAVMIMVSINTFSWRRSSQLRTNPLPSSVVMLATVATVVATHDLAKGVLVGVLLSGVFFAGKVSRLSRVTSTLSEDGRTRTYRVEGQVFFASAGTFSDAIDVHGAVERIVIDVHRRPFLGHFGHFGALDRVVLKARRHAAASSRSSASMRQAPPWSSASPARQGRNGSGPYPLRLRAPLALHGVPGRISVTILLNSVVHATSRPASAPERNALNREIPHES